MVEFLTQTDEHRLLHETAARLFREPEQLLHTLAESGLLALPFAEADGGWRADGSIDRTDQAIAFAAKGQAYCADSILLQAVLGGDLIAAGSTAGKAAIVQSIIEGRERIAVGLHEPHARTDLYHCATTATETAEGWILDGAKTLVLGAEGASRLVILARVGERGADVRTGLGLFWLDPSMAGVACRHYRLRDGSPASDIALAGAVVPEGALLAGPDTAADLLDHAVAMTRLCLAAEASGLMSAILAGTATYVTERKQFGQAIGSFQVIQHRLADMATLTDQSAALVADIARRSDDLAAIDRAHRAIAEMGMTVAKAAIQLHGGYGMTEDLPYGGALRRMMTIALLF